MQQKQKLEWREEIGDGIPAEETIPINFTRYVSAKTILHSASYKSSKDADETKLFRKRTIYISKFDIMKLLISFGVTHTVS